MAEQAHNGTDLAVVVANEHVERLEDVRALVVAAGHRVVGQATDLDAAVDAIVASDADLAVVAVHRSGRHALDLVERLNDTAPCPVVLLLNDEDPELVGEALDRGLDAYAGRPTVNALQSAIELAQHRYGELRDLGRQVRDMEAGAARRALIERAKGVVMERLGVDEREAYERLRAHARTNRLSLADVAEAVIRTSGLFPGGDPR